MKQNQEEQFPKYQALANKHAHGWAKKTGIPFEELQAIAYLGLSKAIHTHNPKKSKLITWAYQIIRNELKKETDKLLNHTLEFKPADVVGDFVVERKVEFDNSVANLGKEARAVCHIIFAGPNEFLGLEHGVSVCKVKKALRDWLREQGKNGNQIREIFAEILTVFH